MISFPTEDRTFAFNLKTKHWCEWADFNQNSSQMTRFKMNCYVNIPDWNLQLIGDRTTGKIYSISVENDDDAGEYIKNIIRTNVIDYGISTKKRSNRISLSFKRGKGKTDEINTLDTNADPHFLIRWKDNDKDWSNYHKISAGKISEFRRQVHLRGMGIFINRVYEISCTDKIPFILYDAEEDIEALQ